MTRAAADGKTLLLSQTGDIVAGLNRGINQALARLEVADKIVLDGGRTTPLAPAQFADFVRTDGEVYEDLPTAELCAEFVVESCSSGGVFAQ